MEITSDFELALPPDEAYELLLDLERVAPCMPGATLGGEREDGARELEVTVRLGPMKMSYGGTVEVAERDEASRRAVLVGSAREKKGQGSANARITMTVSPAGDGSRVDSTAVIDLTGRAAQTGRGLVEDVARRMVGQMAECLAAHVTSPKPGAAGEGLAGETEYWGPAGAGGAAGEGLATVTSPNPGAAAETHLPPADSPPIKAGSLALSILWERLRRLFRRRGR
jgi:carbon monoxide dehydrogenase subunit G